MNGVTAQASTAAVVLLLLLIAYIRSILSWRARSRGLPLPPGPKALPVVGNILDVPTYKPWIGFRDLSARYGDIMHFQVFGQRAVVLGSADVLTEFLDKRAANTSDRQRTPLPELVGADIVFVFMPYGQWWRRQRRAFWQYFNPTACADYRPAQRDSARRFLAKLMDDPANFIEHIRHTYSSTLLRIIYNLNGEEDVKKQISMVEMAMEGVTQGLLPGRFLVEFFPVLQRLPSYFLGAELRTKGPKWREAAMTLTRTPFLRVKAAIAEDKDEAQRSIVGKLLAQISRQGYTGSTLEEEEDIAQNVGSVAFQAGSDTTYSVTQATFLAMSLYPDVLQKVHAELDAVVGPDRLPDFDDQGALVYVNAVIKESLRWQATFGLGIPHCTTADDEFRGYFIPAGTVLLPNTWAVMRDPEAYEDPDEYRPDRFIKDGKLDPSVRDPSAFVWGYGRRICPGRHFAEATLFITLASVLHVFAFSPPLDERGQPIRIVPDNTDGLISYPEDARCTIKPRGAWAEALIRGAQTDSEDA